MGSVDLNQRSDCAKHHDCGVNKTLKIIGSKWTMHLLHNLFDGPKRFGELQRNADGISPKTLTLRLRELEKDRIIIKKVFAEIPLHVEYSLTDKGKSLKEIFTKMEHWGQNN